VLQCVQGCFNHEKSWIASARRFILCFNLHRLHATLASSSLSVPH